MHGIGVNYWSEQNSFKLTVLIFTLRVCPYGCLDCLCVKRSTHTRVFRLSEAWGAKPPELILGLAPPPYLWDNLRKGWFQHF